MPLVAVPKPTFAQKLKRFFMADLLKGLGLTLKFNLCALACPEDCIDVIPMDVEVVVAGKPRRKKVLDEFIFDTSRCMFCALCQEACPTYCLELTQDFELATYSRAGFVWNREMLEQGRETVKYTS